MMSVLIALLLSQAGSPTPRPAPVFADAAIGASATLLLESLGEPVVRRQNDAGGNEYVYVSPGSSLEFVEVQGGNVTPWSSASLRGTILCRALQLRRLGFRFAIGLRSLLRSLATGLSAGRIREMQHWELSTATTGSNIPLRNSAGRLRILQRLPIIVEQTLPPGTEPTLHGGSSFADAIVLKSSLDSLDVRGEYAYLSAHPRGTKGYWRKSGQAMVTREDIAYDVLSAVCTQGSSRRNFYFDITGYLGKFH